MAECYIDRLPTELLIHIFSDFTDLDAAPPSISNFSLAPSTRLTKSTKQPLKTLALVSRRWRGIILPTLFRHATVHLEFDKHWLRLCPGLGASLNRIYRPPDDIVAVSRNIEHLMEDATSTSLGCGGRKVTEDTLLGLEYRKHKDYSIPPQYLHWLPSPRGEVEDFLLFLRANDLCKSVKTLVLYSQQEVDEKRTSMEDTLIFGEVRNLWRQIFKSLPLDEIIVAAPPATMAALSGGREHRWDWWLFEMDFHYLKLSRPPCRGVVAAPPSGSPSPCRQVFLYNIAPWTHVAYNDGTFLRAYSHYEYQWKKPPDTFPSLLDWLVKEKRSTRGPQITNVEYICAFPYGSHLLNIATALAKLDTLASFKVKLAEPDLLSNKDLMGRAQPSDVYSEWEHCYKMIRRNLLSATKSKLTFIAEDTRLPTLRDQVHKCIEDTIRLPAVERIQREEHDGVTSWVVNADVTKMEPD